MCFRKIFKLQLVMFILLALTSFLTACNNGIVKGSGTGSSVAERLKQVQQSSTSGSAYLIPSVSESDLLNGKMSEEQIAVGDMEFKNSCFSSLSVSQKDSSGRDYAWVNDSFMYFRFKLSGDYILPKNFVIYYNDVLDSEKYPEYNTNPVLNNMYMVFNGVITRDIYFFENSIYCTIPKSALDDKELEVMVLFPTGGGDFYEKGAKVLSILGIGFIDNNVETISINEGTGYPMQCTTMGNLDRKTSIGWHAIGDDGTWTREDMRFYFKVKDKADMRIVTSYETLSDKQSCKVYLNDKFLGELSKKEDIKISKDDLVDGIQKVEYKIENAVPASELSENGLPSDFVGIKVRSITIK